MTPPADGIEHEIKVVAEKKVRSSSSVSVVVTALSISAFVFTGLIRIYLAGGISEAEESRIFVLACLTVPAAGIFGSWGLERLGRRYFDGDTLVRPVLAIAQVVFWAGAVFTLRRALPPTDTGEHVDLRPLFGKILTFWGLGNAGLFTVFAALRPRPTFSSNVSWAIERVLPLAIFAALLPFAARNLPSLGTVALALAFGFSSLVGGELVRFPRRRGPRYAVDALVLLTVLLLVVDPAMDVDVYHHNFFLGPTAAARAGKSLLVDVNCQYGVGLIYFLAAILDRRFVSPSPSGLAVLLGLFTWAEYAVLYATMRTVTRSAALSAAILLVMVVVPTFEQLNFQSYYPSAGALRFLPGFLLVGCIALRGRFSARRRWLFAAEALVVGVTSIWSLEAFVYVFVAYFGSLVYEAAHAERGQIVRSFVRRVVPTALSIVLWHAVIAAWTFARAGEGPQWSRYFEYIRLYSVQEFGCLPIEPWTPWLLIAGAYIATIVALGYRRITLGKSDLKFEYATAFAMSALGVAQFTYYLGRSHSNNLFHVCLPALFVGGFWLIRIASDSELVSRAFRPSFLFVGACAAAMLALSASSDLAHKFDHTLLGFVATERTPAWPAPSRRAADAVILMRTYAPNARRVALVSTPDVEVEAFLVTRKASIWPLAYLPQDLLLPSARQRILSFDDGLKSGEVVFVDTRSTADGNITLAHDVDPVEKELWAGIVRRFGTEVLSVRPSGLAAVRLTTRR
ncbi:hypothetical protein AKJ09_01498 [Labilithrix luteola]|uniref:Uncharacterized protein n=1 Tax=Labilithrix luteola TaxID=1391654 RepID=A0A0K1PNY9_9BACT|nr:hypothetical protein [Labilithrix luteola]AKU94834.1 hypothetical protein AKJ09_01498 [Labilithrix luteola]